MSILFIFEEYIYKQNFFWGYFRIIYGRFSIPQLCTVYKRYKIYVKEIQKYG